MFNSSEIPPDSDALQLYINSAQTKEQIVEKSPHELYLAMMTNSRFVRLYKKINNGSSIINTLTPSLGYGDIMKPNLFIVFGQDRKKNHQIQLLIRQECYQSQEADGLVLADTSEVPLSMEEMAKAEVPMFKKLLGEPWQKTTELMNGGPKEWLNRTLPITAELMEKYPDVAETILGGIAEGLVGFQKKLDKRPHSFFSNNQRLVKMTSSLQSATAKILQTTRR